MNTPAGSSPISRVFIIVLDSAGVGFLPDAGEYGDSGGDLGANTLGHIGDAVGLTVPNMEALGLGRIIPIRGVKPVDVSLPFEREAALPHPPRGVATGATPRIGVMWPRPSDSMTGTVSPTASPI